MKARSYVKISKISASKDPEYLSPTLDVYEAGKDNGDVSLPVEYWLEGYLMEEPTVGKSVVVQREIRCGIKAGGIFRSSPVVQITEDGFETLNSIYKLEFLKWKNL